MKKSFSQRMVAGWDVKADQELSALERKVLESASSMFSVKRPVQPRAAAYCHVCGWKVTAAGSEAALEGVIEHVIYVHPTVVELAQELTVKVAT